MGQFARDLDQGRLGVARAIPLLSAPGTRSVVDVQDDPFWMPLGVDLLWEVLPGRFVAIEVKYERRDTGNFALESISNVNRRSPGWWLTSHAHIVLYGFRDTDAWWALMLPGLRDAIRDDEWRCLTSVRARTTGAYATSCRLLPQQKASATGHAFRLTSPLPARIGVAAPHVTGTPRARVWRIPSNSCSLRSCTACGAHRQQAA